MEAFSELLRNFPQEADIAFVLVQHLDPSHQSVLPEILGRLVKLPLTQVTDGVVVEARHVYVIPANTTMVIKDGALRLGARVVRHGPYMPVDEFLLSLAEECGNRAIGVILSGMASDGTEGCRAIKAAGGITFAQKESSARFSGMPGNAIPAGCVDFVMSLDAIAKELARISRHPYLKSVVPDDDEAGVHAATELDQILQLLRRRSGVDFTLYKKSTPQRRVGRRMVVHHFETIEQYLNFVREHPEELDELYRDILIPVTEFFRDAQAFEALRKQVFPHLFRNRKLKTSAIRIWIPGCSTGEEVYSIAIALLEYMWKSHNLPQGSLTTSAVQIFGTDISDHALSRARAGLYAHAAVAQVSPERLHRFFMKLDGGYQINKSLRELCIFAKQDVTRDPPFSNLDLISCRNVLIYLGPALQERVIPTFHYALKAKGFLLLGESEGLRAFSEYFLATDKKQKIYQKKGTATHLLSYFATPGPALLRTEEVGTRPASSGLNSEKEIERSLAQHYAPTSIVVNSQMEVVQFRGKTGAYLEPAEGQPTFSLSKMAREGLLVDLRRAIDRAKKESVPIRAEGIRVKSNGATKEISLDVIPVRGRNVKERFYVVAFHDAERTRADARASKQAKGRLSQKPAGRAGETERLKREIASMKEQMRDLIEDNESTVEEYKSANEEVLSTNEELQSTNQELERAKEELQSSNEELTTLNEELQNRNGELIVVNNDLTNLLGNVNIPVVMIGNDLRIRRFTPPAQKLLNLLPSDIGRRLGEIRPNIDFDQLEETAREAIDNAALQDREVREKDGRWHWLRVRPYKTWDGRIDGAVISLQDIHALKAAAEQSRTYADTLIETSRECILILNTDLRVTTANPAFYRIFGVSPAETEGRLIYELGDGQWDIPELCRLLETVIPENARVDDYEVEHQFPGVGLGTMLLNARRIDLRPGEGMVFLAIEDVTDKKKHAAEVSQLAALIDLAYESVIVRDWEGRIQSWNRGAEELYGWPAEEAKGKIIHELLQTQFPKPLEKIKEELQRTGHWEGELVHLRRDGEQRIVSSRWAIRPQSGRTPLIMEINNDVTQRMRSERNLRELSTYLMRIQDEERRRIARELHDSTGQKLVAVKMNLEAMKTPSKSKTNHPKILSESIQLVDEANQEIRVLAQLLHPPLLDEAGLVSALKWLVEGFTSRARIPVNVTASAELSRLPDNVEIALFRIVQEALNNIYRHSGATKAWIELKRNLQVVELRISDNGTGMPAELSSGDDQPALGVGILGMKERIAQLGGRLEIKSGKEGTTIVASVEVADAANPQRAAD